MTELFVIIASTLPLFLATDFSNSFAIHIFSTNLIKENTGSQAVTGTCSDWNLQPFNLHHISWCTSDVEEVKDIFGVQNHVGVGFNIWQNKHDKEANGMVDL